MSDWIVRERDSVCHSGDTADLLTTFTISYNGDCDPPSLHSYRNYKIVCFQLVSRIFNDTSIFSYTFARRIGEDSLSIRTTWRFTLSTWHTPTRDTLLKACPIRKQDSISQVLREQFATTAQNNNGRSQLASDFESDCIMLPPTFQMLKFQKKWGISLMEILILVLSK